MGSFLRDDEPVTPPKAAVPLTPAPFVTLALFSALSGYSEKAMRNKIERGVWLIGHEVVRAPDGRLLVSMDGYARWANQSANASHRRDKPSGREV